MRLITLFLGLTLLFSIPFFLFGDRFEEWLTLDGAIQWLRSYGPMAWAMAILLLVSDLVLPIPATAVMTGLGLLYGPWVGGAVGGVGAFLSGVAGYVACRFLGRGAARRLAGEKDLARAEGFFERTGGFAVVVSRWLPLLPEVVACLAGLSRMPAPRFLVALACGSFPMAFTFAYLGHHGGDHPVAILLGSALLPLGIWILVRPLLFRQRA